MEDLTNLYAVATHESAHFALAHLHRIRFGDPNVYSSIAIRKVGEAVYSGVCSTDVVLGALLGLEMTNSERGARLMRFLVVCRIGGLAEQHYLGIDSVGVHDDEKMITLGLAMLFPEPAPPIEEARSLDEVSDETTYWQKRRRYRTVVDALAARVTQTFRTPICALAGGLLASTTLSLSREQAERILDEHLSKDLLRDWASLPYDVD